MTTMTKLIMAAVAVALIVLILYLQGCDGRRALGDQKRIEKGQTGAVIESSQDAMNTQAGVATNDVATSDLDRKNEKEIKDATGADATTGDAGRAGVRSLCRRAAYRNRPECRVQ